MIIKILFQYRETPEDDPSLQIPLPIRRTLAFKNKSICAHDCNPCATSKEGKKKITKWIAFCAYKETQATTLADALFEEIEKINPGYLFEEKEKRIFVGLGRPLAEREREVQLKREKEKKKKVKKFLARGNSADGKFYYDENEDQNNLYIFFVSKDNYSIIVVRLGWKRFSHGSYYYL